jgi:hypothetical protein
VYFLGIFFWCRLKKKMLIMHFFKQNFKKRKKKKIQPSPPLYDPPSGLADGAGDASIMPLVLQTAAARIPTALALVAAAVSCCRFSRLLLCCCCCC